MATSTNGILCYGIDFGEDRPWDIEEMTESGFGRDDTEEYMAFVLGGLQPPKEEYSLETKEIHEKYWEQKTEVLEESGVKLVEHCSDECTMYILAVAVSVKKARRGYPVSISWDNNQVTPKKRAKLMEALQKFGHEDRSEPEWLLCSMWG